MKHTISAAGFPGIELDVEELVYLCRTIRPDNGVAGEALHRLLNMCEEPHTAGSKDEQALAEMKESFVKDAEVWYKLTGDVHLACRNKVAMANECRESPSVLMRMGRSVSVCQPAPHSFPRRVPFVQRADEAHKGPPPVVSTSGGDYSVALPYNVDVNTSFSLRYYDSGSDKLALLESLAPGMCSWAVKIKTRKGEEMHHTDAASGDAARVAIRKRVEGVLKVISCKQISREEKPTGFHK